MSGEVMGKLRRHIERTGRYEPLVVRPHPAIGGAFELINGHHRKEVLESLGYAEAQCLVWDLSDAETLMLLATINRLGGEDAPGKRLGLLESLSEAMAASAAELAKFLPESGGDAGEGAGGGAGGSDCQGAGVGGDAGGVHGVFEGRREEGIGGGAAEDGSGYRGGFDAVGEGGEK